MRRFAGLVLAAGALAAGGCGRGEPVNGTAAAESALVVSNRGGAWRVYEARRDGGGARLVGSPRADDASYSDGQPARLPDGAIVFVSDRGGRPALYLRERGREEARLLFGAAGAPEGAPQSDPAPSGAGAIVFAAAVAGTPGADPAAAGGRDLYLARRDGTALRRLTSHPADDGAPCVLPDGRTVVFASDRGGGRRLFRLDAQAADPDATTAPLLAGATGTVDDAPACLADGSILFARSIGGGPTQVFQARFTASGAAERQITDAKTLPFGAGEPVPSADGTILLTAGPGPANGPRYAVYGISGGGYNLARVTRERAGYEDLTRRLHPPR